MKQIVYIKADSHAIKALRAVNIPESVITDILGKEIDVDEYFQYLDQKNCLWSIPPNACEVKEQVIERDTEPDWQAIERDTEPEWHDWEEY